MEAREEMMGKKSVVAPRKRKRVMGVVAVPLTIGAYPNNDHSKDRFNH